MKGIDKKAAIEKKQWKKENGYRLAEKMEKRWRLLVTLFNYQRFLFLSQLYSHSKLNETIRELKCNSTLYVLRRIIILFRRRSSLTRNLSLFLVTLTEIAFTFGLICKRISNEFIPKCQGYIFWENWMISWRKGSFMNEGSLTPIHLQRSSESDFTTLTIPMLSWGSNDTWDLTVFIFLRSYLLYFWNTISHSNLLSLVTNFTCCCLFLI